MKVDDIEQAAKDLAHPSLDVPKVGITDINGKPALRLPGDDRPIGEFAEELGMLLHEEPIFSRQGIAFALSPDQERLEPASPTWLRTWVEQKVSCFLLKKGREGESIRMARTMSEDVARAVLASPQFLSRLRIVEFFNPSRLPIMRQNGRIELLGPGYDPQSLTYTVETAPDIEPVSMEMAKAILAELLEEFPFPDDGGRSIAVAVSAMVTVFASRLLPRGSLRPCFIYLGNAEGSGKTMLARLACTPYANADIRGTPNTEEEFGKSLLAAVIAGRKVIVFDNAKGHLNSAKLEGFLTAPRYSGRILGVSREFSGEVDTTVLITGNSLTISPDLRRRTLVIQLFMYELRAEDRKFKRLLDEPAIIAMRSRILSALWQLLQSWDADGRPKASRGNTSFPRWCHTIGGIVEHAGYGCPTAPAEIQGVGDTDTADIAQLAELMAFRHPYQFAELVVLADQAGLFERFMVDKDADGNLSKRAKSAFPKLLLTYHERQVTQQKRFMVDGKGHSRRYLAL